MEYQTDANELARKTLALVLAGGSGSRLGDLTKEHCKPAIPFAGHYRNIDFTLSNCVNSGVRRIGVLTQYKAQSLISHLAAGWGFLPRALGEFVEVWPAQQRARTSWYAGTADAVYQNLDLIEAHSPRYTLVLAGDHIYKMDYRRLLAQHAASGADVTVACIAVGVEVASSFGVVGADARSRITSFLEKPAPAVLRATGNSSVLASMGIYVFNTEYLMRRLRLDTQLTGSTHDFGRDILPATVREDYAGAYLFAESCGRPAYWRDVGTLLAYWQAHMELLDPEPALDLYDPAWPIWTQPVALAPAKLLCDAVRRGGVSSSLLAAGVIVKAATVVNSVLSTQVCVEEGAHLDQAVVLPGARIGGHCRLQRVIIDCNTQVPEGTVLEGHEVPILLTQDGLETGLRSAAA